MDFIELYFLHPEGPLLNIVSTRVPWSSSGIQMIKDQGTTYLSDYPAGTRLEIHCARKASSDLPALSYKDLEEYLESLPENQRKDLKDNLNNWPDPIQWKASI